MPNPEALILARVAIEALSDWKFSFQQGPELYTSVEHVAAALERYIEAIEYAHYLSKTEKNKHGQAKEMIETLYRITDKPKEANDGE